MNNSDYKFYYMLTLDRLESLHFRLENWKDLHLDGVEEKAVEKCLHEIKSVIETIRDNEKNLEEEKVIAISYNPFTPSQIKLLEKWFASQCDYFHILEQEHPNEIYYSGMSSASKLMRDKFILEKFVSTL